MSKIRLQEQAASSTPAADKIVIYPKAGGKIYKKSDDGVEEQFLTNVGQQTIPTINLTGGQIAFPATAVPSADANTMDDYEEGTWTPVIAGNEGVSGQTYSVQTGKYTKTGRGVSASFSTTLTAKGTITGSYLIIAALPFNCVSANAFYHETCPFYFENLAINCISLVGVTINASNNIFIWVATAAQASLTRTNPATNYILNTTMLTGAITYTVAT